MTGKDDSFDESSGEDRFLSYRRFIVEVLLTPFFLVFTASAGAQEIPRPPLRQIGMGVLERVAYSPDGRLLATSGGAGVAIWEIESGALLRILTTAEARSHYVISMDFNRDGSRLLTGGTNGQAIIWDVVTGKPVWVYGTERLEDVTAYIPGVAFSPDDQHVLLARVQLGALMLDAETADFEAAFYPGSGYGLGDMVLDAAFSPDGSNVLTASADGMVRLWSIDEWWSDPIQEFDEHTGMVWAVAFSPDGSRILTGGEDGDVLLWDTQSGSRLRSFTRHSGTVRDVEFHPEQSSKLAYSGSDTYSGYLWNWETGQTVHSFHSIDGSFSRDWSKLALHAQDLDWGSTGAIQEAHIISVSSGSIQQRISGFQETNADIGFSLTADRLYTGVDRFPQVWDTQTGEPLERYYVHKSGGTDVAITGYSSEFVLASSDGTVTLWDMWDGELLRRFEGHTGAVWSVDGSGDGTRILTGGKDGTARLWDGDTGEQIRLFEGHTDDIWAVNLSPDKSMAVTASGDGTAKVWNTETGLAVCTFTGHGAAVLSADFHPYGELVLTGGADGKARLWNAESGVQVEMYEAHTDDINDVKYQYNGSRFITASSDTTAKLWDAETGEVLRTVDHGFYPVVSADISYNGSSFASADLFGTIYVTSTLTGSRQATMSLPDATGTLGGNEWINAIAYNAFGPIISAHLLTPAVRWNVSTQSSVMNYGDHIMDISVLDVSPDGQMLVTGGADGRVIAWNTVTGEFERSLSHSHLGGVSALRFSPDGSRLATGGVDDKVALYSSTLSTFRTLSGHNGSITDLSFDAEANYLLSGSLDGRAKLWSVSSGSSLHTFDVDYNVYSVALSPDGTRACVGDLLGMFSVFDTQSGSRLRYFRVHDQVVNSIEYSVDGLQILTAGSDHEIKLWDAETFQTLHVFKGHREEVLDARFLPDGHSIVSTGLDGLILTWELDAPRAVLLAAGDPDPDINFLGQETISLVGYAAETLLARGYSASDIRILSSYPEPIMANGVEFESDPLTKQAFRNVLLGEDGNPGWIDEGAYAGRRVLVYMMDHGARRDDGTSFFLNECEALHSTELDSWLDELEEGELNRELTVIAECCYSGAFVEDCLPDEGQRRAVIASAQADQQAIILPPPDSMSFSLQFFGAAFMGASMGEAFELTRNFYETLTEGDDGEPEQLPIMADTAIRPLGLGYLGASWAYAGGGSAYEALGTLGTVTIRHEGTVIDTGDIVPLDAEIQLDVEVDSLGNPETMLARVSPPAAEILGGEPVQELDELPFQLISGQDRNWRTTVTLDRPGTYRFAIYGSYQGQRRSKPIVVAVNVIDQDWDETRPLAALLVAGQEDPVSQTGSVDGQSLHLTAVAFKMTRKRYDAEFLDDVSVLGPARLMAEYGTSFPQNATKSRIESELVRLAQLNPGAKIFVSLIGPSDPVTGHFVLDGQSNATISADELFGILDTVQATDDTIDFILLVDTPGAGRFLPPLVHPDRIVVTGTQATTGGFLLSESNQSFALRFLSATEKGGTVRASWQAGRNFFRQFKIAGEPGLSNPLLAARTAIGRRKIFASDLGETGVICDTAPSQSINRGNRRSQSPELQIWAELIDGMPEPDRVLAQSMPATPEGLIDAAPTIEMEQIPGSNRWTVPDNYTDILIPFDGAWRISYQAIYESGEPSPVGRRSVPRSTLVRVEASGVEDSYEGVSLSDDTCTSTRNLLQPGTPQSHTLHDEDDEDWGLLALEYGSSYRLELTDLIVPDGVTLALEVYEDCPESAEEPLFEDWVFPGEDELVTVVLQDRVQPAAIYRFRVRRLSGSVASLASYSIALTSGSAGENRTAYQTRPCQVSVPIALDDLSEEERGSLVGFNIYRTFHPDGIEAGPLNEQPIVAETWCDCPTIAGGEASECIEYLDCFDDAGCPDALSILAYRIEALFDDSNPRDLQTLVATVDPIAPLWTDPFCTPEAIPPHVTLVQPVSDNPTSGTEVRFRIVFDQPVLGFDHAASDVEPRLDGLVAGLTRIDSVSASEYLVSFDGISGDGTLRLRVPADAAQNASGIANVFSPWSPHVDVVHAVRGDLNRDGLVTPQDAQEIFQCFMAPDSCTQANLFVGDVCEPHDSWTPEDAQIVFMWAIGMSADCP